LHGSWNFCRQFVISAIQNLAFGDNLSSVYVNLLVRVLLTFCCQTMLRKFARYFAANLLFGYICKLCKVQAYCWHHICRQSLSEFNANWATICCWVILLDQNDYIVRLNWFLELSRLFAALIIRFERST